MYAIKFMGKTPDQHNCLLFANATAYKYAQRSVVILLSSGWTGRLYFCPGCSTKHSCKKLDTVGPGQ